ncbi:unnamed protein product, partial [Allacma fusca]
HYKKCLQEFNQTLGKFLFPKYRVSTYVLCRPISSKYLDIKTEMSRPTLDFEGVEIPEGESVTNNRDLVQALMILHISDIFETTATNLCGFDADRRVNSGV